MPYQFSVTTEATDRLELRALCERHIANCGCPRSPPGFSREAASKSACQAAAMPATPPNLLPANVLFPLAMARMRRGSKAESQGKVLKVARQAWQTRNL